MIFSADRKVFPGCGFRAVPECKNGISCTVAASGHPVQKYNFYTPPETFRSAGIFKVEGVLSDFGDFLKNVNRFLHTDFFITVHIRAEPYLRGRTYPGQNL